MKLPIVALVAIVPLVAWAQAAAPEGEPAFDADSFFSGSGSAGGQAAASGEQAASAASPLSAGRTSGVVFSGEAGTDAMFSIAEPFDEAARTTGYAGLTSIRLDAMGGDRESAKIEASAIVRMVYGDAAAAMRTAAAAGLTMALGTDGALLASYLLGADGPVMSLELKKLYLSIYTRYADLSAGRMIINYGRGTVFSPVDLFSAVDTSDLALGRTGTDAARVLAPFGDFSGLDLVATLAKAAGDAIAGGRLYGDAAGLDFGLSAFADGLADGNGDLVAGLDLKGDIELGVSLEAVARVPFSDWEPNASEAVYSLMLGADYSLGGEWFIDAEYLWNISAGSAYAVGGFRSAHNLFGSISWKPDELTAFDLRCIAAPMDNAVQASLSLSRSIASGAILAGYALYRSGDVKASYLGSGDATDATSVSFGVRLSAAF